MHEGRKQTNTWSAYAGSRLELSDALGRRRPKRHPSSRTGENPPYGMIGGIEETSASFEARSAPRSYPTAATFSSGPSPSNSPSSKPPPPTGPDIDVFDRVKAPSQRGTEGSNLASSSGSLVRTRTACRAMMARGWIASRIRGSLLSFHRFEFIRDCNVP